MSSLKLRDCVRSWLRGTTHARPRSLCGAAADGASPLRVTSLEVL